MPGLHASPSAPVNNGIPPNYRQPPFPMNNEAGQWAPNVHETSNRGQSMSYPGPPPDRTQLHSPNDAFRAPSYSPERKQQASRFQFAQDADDEEGFFLPGQGFGASEHDSMQRGGHAMQNGYAGPGGIAQNNGIASGNPRGGYNSSNQVGNQAQQQALLRAAYEADKRMQNAGGGPNPHFNHPQIQHNQPGEVYYDNVMDNMHMSPQSSPGHSMSPARNQRKGAGKNKNPGNHNQYSQDFNHQAQNWQNQQIEMGYGANPTQQTRGKGQGGRGQARRGKASAEQM